MNKHLSIIIILLISFGCSNDGENMQAIDPNTLNLHNLKGSSKITAVEASIMTPNGLQIIDIDQLKANTEYDIILKGDGASFLRISNGNIFDVLKEPEYSDSMNEFKYRIKTGEDFADRILINVVPLHLKGNSFVREHTQVFFLPY